jgi:hypothetical protein
LSLPDGTRINRHKRSVAAAVTKEDSEVGEYYSDTDEGEYVLQRQIVR